MRRSRVFASPKWPAMGVQCAAWKSIITGLLSPLTGPLGLPDTTSLLSGKIRGMRGVRPAGEAARQWSGPGRTRF